MPAEEATPQKQPLIQREDESGELSQPRPPVAIVVQAERRSADKWNLQVKDFLPKSYNGPDVTYFQQLVDNANVWLQEHPELTVHTIETVVWFNTDPDQLGADKSDQVVHVRAVRDNNTTYALRGFRIWLVPRPAGEPVRTRHIGYMDTVAELDETTEQVVERANKVIQNDKGRVVAVESVPLSDLEGVVDTSVVRWEENSSDTQRWRMALRIWHLNDIIVRETIGIKDLIPKQQKSGEFESYEQLIGRANHWLRSQCDVRVANMESVIVERDGNTPTSGASWSVTIPSFCSGGPPSEYLRILRVTYTKHEGELGSDVTLHDTTYPFTYENFMPEMIRQAEDTHERKERLGEVLERVHHFLKGTRAEVIAVETFPHVGPDSLQLDSQQQPQAFHFVHTLRVFTTAQLVEPAQLTHKNELSNGSNGNHGNQPTAPCSPSASPRLQRKGSSGRRAASPSRQRRGSRGSDASRKSAVEHPGPIFLGNITRRRSPYRYMIGAVTVMIALSVIVIISVLSANGWI